MQSVKIMEGLRREGGRVNGCTGKRVAEIMRVITNCRRNWNARLLRICPGDGRWAMAKALAKTDDGRRNCGNYNCRRTWTAAVAAKAMAVAVEVAGSTAVPLASTQQISEHLRSPKTIICCQRRMRSHSSSSNSHSNISSFLTAFRFYVFIWANCWQLCALWLTEW